jgi:CobQ-like glutamine amidotransferase family enzyme
MLLVCGLYQLFGREFVTSDSSIIKGIGILPVTTSAGEQRIIGNCVVQTEDFGELVGYENHSGQTFLDEGASPLGKALPNSGNNGVDMTEGARYANTFGTYLHGPILSKNPRFSDALISMALMHMGSPHTTLTELDDSLENQAAEFAKTRQR